MMRLRGITLETIYWEDYLSFLVEVLELDLSELTEISMKLDLKDTWLEIKKVGENTPHVASNVEFALEREDFAALVQKVKFFYYRKGPSRFLLLSLSIKLCEIVDPDGRVWRFQQDHPTSIPVPEGPIERNF